MKPNIFLRLLPVALASLALVGCEPAAPKTQAPPPPVVTVAPVEQKEITEWQEFTGRTDAVESVEVRPRVSGHIQEVCFQSGQLVKKGDVLFVIDPRTYQAEYDRAQADYDQAVARMQNTGRSAERSAKLLATKAISSEMADSSDSQFREDKAAVLAAKANVDAARLNLEFTQVRAPVDGRVSRALLTTGNYASGVASQASLLTTVVSVDPIYVYADMDESSLMRFNSLAAERQRAGETRVPVDLALMDEEGFPHHGYIESFDNRLDPGTGTIVMRCVFPSENGLIVPGLFARVRISPGGKRPAMLIDETAVGTDQAQKFVLALGPDNKVEYRKVILGPVVDGKRVIREGLQPGEKILVNGTQRARPGMPVTPEERVATSGTDAKTAER